MIKNILFDLDGTLLPMDQDVFAQSYFKRLVKKLVPLGYESQKVIDTVWAGTAAMVKNDGTVTNEQAFWKLFASVFGDEALKDMPVFDDFYANDFNEVSTDCGYNPVAAEVIGRLKAEGFNLVLATNPIFPSVATESRIRWAGLKKEDFSLYTTYENSHYCKPNPAYYAEIIEKLGLNPDECLMVGNDMVEDVAALKAGIRVFILTDCIINKNNSDITLYPHGGFSELMQYIEENK